MGAASQALIENPNSTIKVSPKTRDRVVKIAAEMGYRHNRAAQVLRQGKSGMIGIIEYQGPDHGMAVQRLHALSAVTAAGFAPFPFSVKFTDAKDKFDACHRMMDVHVDGVLSLVPHQGFGQEQIDRLQGCGIPVVVCSRPNFERVPLFISDAASSVECLTRHMLEQRPASIALLTRGKRTASGIWQMWASESIARGFLNACERQKGKSAVPYTVHYINTPLPPNVIEPVGEMVADCAHGYAAVRMLCEDNMLPEALLCESDAIAMGALRALAEVGLGVPRDILIAGYGDADYSAAGTIPLTTVAPDHKAICGQAVDALFNLIEGTGPRSDSAVWIPGKVVIRQSSTRRKLPQPIITVGRDELLA